MGSYRVGIVDDMFYALHGRLVEEGCEVNVFANERTKGDPIVSDKKSFGSRLGKLLEVDSFEDLMSSNCDFFITPAPESETFSYEVLTGVGCKVLGHGAGAYALELNRTYGNHVASLCGLHVTKPTVYSSPEDFLKAALHMKAPFVVKQSSTSPIEVSTNRTVVFKQDLGSLRYLKMLLASPNAWFRKDGSGGAQIEPYVAGQEVCFGRFFNGKTFVGPSYVCIEHKGAQDGDRGSILTGEVGTTISWHRNTSRLELIWSKLSQHIAGKCAGLIDFNTILDEEGNLHFLEFTVRFGRPTLEVILAGFAQTEQNFSSMAMRLLSGESIDRYFDYRNVYIGVTVYPYGYPLTQNSPSVEFDFPEGAIPFFCHYDKQRKSWRTSPDDRQFVVVARDPSPAKAMEKVYKKLETVDFPGHTWRNDIGKNLPNLYRNLLTHNYIKNELSDKLPLP